MEVARIAPEGGGRLRSPAKMKLTLVGLVLADQILAETLLSYLAICRTEMSKLCAPER